MQAMTVIQAEYYVVRGYKIYTCRVLLDDVSAS